MLNYQRVPTVPQKGVYRKNHWFCHAKRIESLGHRSVIRYGFRLAGVGRWSDHRKAGCDADEANLFTLGLYEARPD